MKRFLLLAVLVVGCGVDPEADVGVATSADYDALTLDCAGVAFGTDLRALDSLSRDGFCEPAGARKDFRVDADPVTKFASASTECGQIAVVMVSRLNNPGARHLPFAWTATHYHDDARLLRESDDPSTDSGSLSGTTITWFERSHGGCYAFGHHEIVADLLKPGEETPYLSVTYSFDVTAHAQ